MAATWRRRLCATTPKASAASSSIRSCRRPIPSQETGGSRAPPSTTASGPARRKRLAAPPIRVSRNLHRIGQQIRGRAADDNRARRHYRQRPQGRARRRSAGRLAAQPELCRPLAPRCAGSDRWARRWPARGHRGDRQEPGRPVTATRSRCSCLGYGLSYGVTCREDYPFATPEDLVAAGRKAFPDYPASVQVRASAAGRMSTKTAATSGRFPPPQRPCVSPSRAASQHFSSPAASIR